MPQRLLIAVPQPDLVRDHVEEEPSLPPRSELSGLESAFIAQMVSGFDGLRAELGELRGELKHQARLQLGAFVLLWLLTVFTLAVVALKDGVDPRAAAEAVQIVSPAPAR